MRIVDRVETLGFFSLESFQDKLRNSQNLLCFKMFELPCHSGYVTSKRSFTY